MGVLASDPDSYAVYIQFIWKDLYSVLKWSLMKVKDEGMYGALHNAQFVQYLYLATEQAGTYLKSGPVWHHLTYINPTLFSCEIDIENSILVSFKL